MKTTISLIASLLLLMVILTTTASAGAAPESSKSKSEIRITCTPDLHQLTTAWVQDFSARNPGIEIEIDKISPTPVLPTENPGINFFTAEYGGPEASVHAFPLVAGREIVVAVVNSGNPCMARISETGVAGEKILNGLKMGNATWGQLLGISQTAGIHYYYLEDGFTKARVSDFLGGEIAATDKMTALSAKDFLTKMTSDPLAIGFCRLNTVLGKGGRELSGGISFLPIDKNGNGRLDFMENIYKNPDEFTRGVWIGKYPKSLTAHLFLTTKELPVDAAEIAFIEYVLTNGQDLLAGCGYSALVGAERQTQLDKLTGTPVNLAREAVPTSLARVFILAVAGLVLILVFISFIVRKNRSSSTSPAEMSKSSGSLEEAGMEVPGGLYFDKSHTWAFLEQDGHVKVGVDDFLQHVTGKITRVEIRKSGERIHKGDFLCTLIQNGKKLNVYSPVSGFITSVNEELSGDGSLINVSPYEKGWICKVEPSNWIRETGLLSMAKKYREWLKSEVTRLRDFFAIVINQPGMAMVSLQDGGAVRDHILEEMGPDVWEKFQDQFIDPVK
jgi:glycine cleavage system H lipoate-binding protein/ABC-type phosphate transport system substrate-binding protein